MPLTDEEFKRTVEEFKEAGHDQRFRDQLIVTEFTFSMGAIGILLSALKDLHNVERLALQIFGLIFLAILTLHLRNINQDRLVAMNRKAKLAGLLEFTVIVQNIDGTKRRSAPLQMIRFTFAATFVWALWTLLPLIVYWWTLLKTVKPA